MSAGRLDEQQWRLNTDAQPQSVNITFSGGFQDLSSTLVVTCSPNVVSTVKALDSDAPGHYVRRKKKEGEDNRKKKERGQYHTGSVK